MTDLARLSIAVDSSSVRAARGDLKGLVSSGAEVESAMHKLLGAMSFGLVAREFWNVNTEFQRLGASLQTVEGDTRGARAAFQQLQDFAQSTPYELAEVTQAYIDLKTRGLDATMGSMTAYGNWASSFGRSMTDLVRAVSGVVVGESEAIKSFGVQAQAQGDKVALTFKGHTDVVKRNATEIENYFKKLANANFGGGMERQMNTVGGAWSNLKDQISSTMFEIGNGGSGGQMVAVLRDLTDGLHEVTPALVKFTNSGLENLKPLAEAIKGLGGGDWGKWINEIGATSRMPMAVAQDVGNLLTFRSPKSLRDWNVVKARMGVSQELDDGMMPAERYAKQQKAWSDAQRKIEDAAESERKKRQEEARKKLENEQRDLAKELSGQARQLGMSSWEKQLDRVNQLFGTHIPASVQASLNAIRAYNTEVRLSGREADALAEAQAERRRDAQEAHEAMQAEADAYEAMLDAAYPYRQELQRLGQSYELLVEAQARGLIGEKDFEKQERILLQQTRQLAAENGDAWASIALQIEENSTRANDAFTDFCFSSKNGFSDLITSMLRDLARLQMQKNLTTPLFSWLSDAVSRWGGSGGSNLYSGGYGAMTGFSLFGNGTESIVGSPVQKVSAAGGGGLSISFPINVSGGNGTVSEGDSQRLTTDIRREVEPIVLQVIAKHQKPGGALNPTRSL